MLEGHERPQYGEIFSLARQEGLSLEEAESRLLGASHAEIGAYLLGLWGFTDSIVEAAAYHHAPMRCASPGFTALLAVYAADALLGSSPQPWSRAGSDSDREIDEVCYESLQLSGHIPDWKILCSVTIEENLISQIKNLIIA